jgi:hypothetical protein
MAKKKRTTKRSTKARKRRPATKRVAAKGGAFQSGAFQSGAFQGLPPSQRKLSAAVQSTLGEFNPSHALRASAAVVEDADTLRATAFVFPAPVPITPTVYPDTPHGTVIVQNHVTINIHSVEFSRFDKNLEALIGELHRSNEISGEIRDQLVSELWAGREIIGAPKPQRGLIDLLLVGPLKWLIEKSGSAMISKLASDALDWLLKMLL